MVNELTMHPRVAEFREMATDSMGAPPRIHELPEETHTAADAAAAIGCDIEQIVKSLVMDAGGDIILVLTSGSKRVEEETLSTKLGVDGVEPASPDTVKEVLGWSIGGVPPFGHDSSIQTFIDPALLEHEEVWAGAGTPFAVFSIDPHELKTLAEAEEIDAFEAG